MKKEEEVKFYPKRIYFPSVCDIYRNPR